ncbi:DEAD/DEAH box helicase [Streptantibioticus silvisoli]|uniref:DEAD/DEAH box helicase n=1 Tax=Streptantibioticus silvisoli TaxID=2705255 RepID=A0ABT6VUH1_9ACTN|nr:DEAD/DEAH box helicase [Streptantibioticus silvisoli]MDI5962107.1 DEAD/DEAH box helicase [Streptantibioticus silvisoli]
MSSGEEPSLRIGFDVTHTKVILHVIPEFREHLVHLAARYMTGEQTAQLVAEVDLEDFLANISLLYGWTGPGVKFEPAVAALAEGSVRDAQAIDARLEAGASGEDVKGEVRPDDVLDRLGADWSGPLTEFQLRDIAKLLSLTHGANFSVPGAGKTRTTLAVYAALREAGTAQRLLVVSPKSAYEAWQEESRLCFTSPPAFEVMEKGRTAAAEVLLVNYERLKQSKAKLADWLSAAPSMLVLDEAHRMKLGVRGAYGAACMTLGPLARHRLILTGTPAPNGAKDLESLLSFVWPGHGRRSVDRAVAGGDLAYASRVLRPLFTRTTKNELGLPPVEFRMQPVQLPPVHRKLYDALIGKYAGEWDEEAQQFERLGKVLVYLMMAATSPALLSEGLSRHEPLPFHIPPLSVPDDDSLSALMRQLPEYEISPKYDYVIRKVAANAKLGRKTLVWSTFVRNLTSLGDILERFSPAVVHGGTADREEQIQRFRNDPDCMVLLSNPATLGEGISLHHDCHDAIYVDRNFAAGGFLQSMDRIHRLGLAPDTKTQITVLVADGTVDEIVHERLALKLEFIGGILDDPAVRQLADPLEEEEHWGMNAADLAALLGHLKGGSSSR